MKKVRFIFVTFCTTILWITVSTTVAAGLNPGSSPPALPNPRQSGINHVQIQAAARPDPTQINASINEIFFLIGDRKYSDALALAQALMENHPGNAEGYYYLCQILKKMDHLHWGEGYFLEKLERDPDNPFLLFAVGCVYQSETEYHQSLQFLERAIAIDSRHEMFYDVFLYVVDILGEEERGLRFLEGLFRHQPDNCFLSSSISELYLYLNDNAAFYRWESLAYRQNPDFMAAAMLHIQRLSFEGDYRQAIALCQQWAEKTEAAGKLRQETYFSMQLGSLYLDNNEYEKAIELINKAFNLCTIIGDDNLERFVEELYATYYLMLDYYPRAIEHYQNVLTYAERIKNIKIQADVRLQLGTIHAITGDYQNAYDYFNQSLLLSLKVQENYFQAQALKRLGDLKYNFNELDDSEQYYLQALKMADKMDEPYTRCLLLNDLGMVADARKEYEKAMDFYRRALKQAAALDYQTEEGAILLNMGLNQSKTGKHDLAMANMRQALRFYQTAREFIGIGAAYRLMGHAYYRQKQYSLAMPFYQQSREISTRIHTVPQLIYSLKGIGNCYREMGNIPEAIRHYEAALKLLEDMENQLQNMETRFRFGEDLFEYYEALIGICGQMYEKNHDDASLARAFELSEQAKARNLSAAIAKSRLLQKVSGFAPALTMQLLLLNKKLELKQREYVDRFGGGINTTPEAIAVRAEISLLEKHRAEFIDKIHRENPRFFQLVTPGVISLRELQSRLPADTAALEFFVGEKDTYYWVIRRDGLSFGKLGLSRDQLTDLLRLASFNLYSPKKVEFFKDYLKNQRWAGIGTKALHGLHQRLFAPLAGRLRGVNRLLIIPDDKLNYLPFEMLVTSLGSRDEVHFLIEQFSINYLPFAGLIDALPEAAPAKDRGNVLVMGDPDFSDYLDRKLGEKTVPLSHLPYSGEEAREIYDLFPHSRLFVGKDATESNFKQFAPHYRILHPSTHNFLDDRQPFYSRLVFAPDPKRGEDGSLYTYEIFNMNLKADMVVLSGCETGLGLLSRGEGIMGISRAFMYAGASSLVVSLWPVGDSSTSRLMTSFYHNLWQGKTKADSLRQAKLEMIRDPALRDPFYWAPFILIGDPGMFSFKKETWSSPPWLSLMLMAVGLLLLLGGIAIYRQVSRK